MLFLTKCLTILVLPIGVVVALLLLGIWRRKRWPLVLATLGLWCSSMRIVSDTLLGWLESRCRVVPIAQAGTGDAIVVLSGIFGPPVESGYVANFGESVERFEGGLSLTAVQL